jgi:hypothetical protein
VSFFTEKSIAIILLTRSTELRVIDEVQPSEAKTLARLFINTGAKEKERMVSSIYNWLR